MADRRSTAIERLKRTLQNARRAWWVLLIIVIYMFLALMFLGTPCLFASVSGVPCMGCGATRAFASLMRGDIAGSLHYHPLLIPGIVFACVYVAIWLFWERKPQYLDRVLIAFIIIVFSVYAVRMVMMFPDTAPMDFNSKAILPRVIQLIRG